MSTTDEGRGYVRQLEALTLASEARAAVEHALQAIDAGQYGEAWIALKRAMRKLDEAER